MPSKWIRPEKRLAIILRDNSKCLICGEHNDLTLDHYIPRSKGGSNKKQNIFTSCRSCNSSRGNKDLHSFVSKHVYLRINRYRKRSIRKTLIKAKQILGLA